MKKVIKKLIILIIIIVLFASFYTNTCFAAKMHIDAEMINRYRNGGAFTEDEIAVIASGDVTCDDTDWLNIIIQDAKDGKLKKVESTPTTTPTQSSNTNANTGSNSNVGSNQNTNISAEQKPSHTSDWNTIYGRIGYLVYEQYKTDPAQYSALVKNFYNIKDTDILALTSSEVDTLLAAIDNAMDVDKQPIISDAGKVWDEQLSWDVFEITLNRIKNATVDGEHIANAEQSQYINKLLQIQESLATRVEAERNNDIVRDNIANNVENPGEYIDPETGKPYEDNKMEGLLGNPSNKKHTLGEIIRGAFGFIDADDQKTTVNDGNLQSASGALYSIFLGLGVGLAVAIGVYLGIKFMVSSVEDKAKVKEAIIPYIAGCVIVFGAFSIWNLVVTILNGIN